MQHFMDSVQFLQVNFSYVWDVLLAVLFTMIGAFYARKSMDSREIQRVVRELTNIQEEMFQRATKGWKQAAPREVWMVGLYFERVATLRTLLDDNGQAGHRIFDHFEQYERSLRTFAKVWAGTSNRGERFWASYGRTYEHYRTLVKLLDRGFLLDNAATIEKLSTAGLPNVGDYSGPRSKEKGRRRAPPASSVSGAGEMPATKTA